MVFSSPSFVFMFLPVALAICFLCRGRAYLEAILFVSFAFYFWSAGSDTLILLALILGNYFGAVSLSRRPSPALYALLIVANLAILIVFKYSGFLALNFDYLAGTNLNRLFSGIVLPAGVSFFVFQAISYVTDVRRRTIDAEMSLVTYGTYQAFFPHLIAGPIVRYKDVADDFKSPRLTVENFSCGISRFCHGLLKKTMIADGVAPIANAAFALPTNGTDFGSAWLGATAYAIQIYFDFSGYSDMAIGLAQMFGIRFHENFARPYVSRSITEFWRRWHISLSSWFRDYVYIPLGGSRGSNLKTYRNLLIVFVVTGLWHGAAWTFLLWGLFHGAFLVLERMAFRSPLEALSHPVLRYVYCLPVVIFAWVLFRATSLDQALHLWGAMLSPSTWIPIEDTFLRIELTPYSATAFVAGTSIFLLPGKDSFGSLLTEESTNGAIRFVNLGYTATALAISSLLILTGSYSPFLYFTF